MKLGFHRTQNSYTFKIDNGFDKSFNNNTQSINNNNLFKMQTRLYCTPKCQNMKKVVKKAKCVNT